MSRLTEAHKLELESILQAKTEGSPRFDMRAIQRYVLWRVFDLGWTIERFGEFDRFSIGDHGREANKPERMGKKYQWLAYHEILIVSGCNLHDDLAHRSSCGPSIIPLRWLPHRASSQIHPVQTLTSACSRLSSPVRSALLLPFGGFGLRRRALSQ